MFKDIQNYVHGEANRCLPLGKGGEQVELYR